MPAIMTPPSLPVWALPLACSMSERGAPHFLAKLCSARYSFLRHVIALNAAFEEEPDWEALAQAVGAGDADVDAPGFVATQLLKMPIRRLVALGGLLRLSPFMAASLARTSTYLAPFTYRELCMVEARADGASRMRAMQLAPVLTQDTIAVLLEIDPAFTHPAIAAQASKIGANRFNQIVSEIRATCEPAVEEALFQALIARGLDEDCDIESIVRQLVQSHYRIPGPALRAGSRLQVIHTLSGLRAAGVRLKNCLGSHVARRILTGERLSVVVCGLTDMVALLRPLICGARRSWLVVDVGALGNRPMELAEQEKFISYLNTELEEPVWRTPGDQKRRIHFEHTPLQRLFRFQLDDDP
jgi:hypothetical protein